MIRKPDGKSHPKTPCYAYSHTPPFSPFPNYPFTPPTSPHLSQKALDPNNLPPKTSAPTPRAHPAAARGHTSLARRLPRRTHYGRRSWTLKPSLGTSWTWPAGRMAPV